MQRARFLLVLLLVSMPLGCRWGGGDAARELEYVETVIGNPESQENLPLIIAIHGLGDSPEVFLRTFLAEFPAAARVIAPRAPIPHGSGYSWFAIPSSGVASGDAITEGLRQAGETVAELIERLTLARRPPLPPIVLGYSQGGMLSFYLAARHPALVSAALPIAGFLPTALLPTAATPAPTYAFHGAEDDIVPLAAARITVEALRQRGGVAELTDYPHVAHAVNLAVLRAVQKKAAGLLSLQASAAMNDRASAAP